MYDKYAFEITTNAVNRHIRDATSVRKNERQHQNIDQTHSKNAIFLFAAFAARNAHIYKLLNLIFRDKISTITNFNYVSTNRN